MAFALTTPTSKKLDADRPKWLSKFRADMAHRTRGEDVFEAINNGLLWKEVTLTSAQLLALNTTPIEVVAAPGAGYAVVFQEALAWYNYGATAYTLNSSTSFFIRYNGSGVTITSFTPVGFSDQTNDEYRYMWGGQVDDDEADANTAIEVSNNVADWTLGDGTITLVVFYREVKVG